MRFKRATKGETGQAKKYSKWPWSSYMSFLDATLQYRAQSSNVGTREVGDETSSPAEPTSALMDNINNSSFPPPEMPHPPPAKKKKISPAESSESEVDKVIDFLGKKKVEDKNLDGVDHMFLSYAATFKTFRPRTQALLKLKLATIFAETEVNELQEQERALVTSPAYSHRSSTELERFNYDDESTGTTSTGDSTFLSTRDVFEKFDPNNF